MISCYAGGSDCEILTDFTSFFCTASACRTSNASFSLLLFLINIEYCHSYYNKQNCYDYQILHRYSSLNLFYYSYFFYAAFFSSYSDSKRLFVLIISPATIKAIISTAIRPGTNPFPTAPVVTSVPI